MPALVVDHAALLRLIWANSGEAYAINVIGIDNTGLIPITQALTNTLGAAIKAEFAGSNLDDCIASTVGLATVGLRSIHEANQVEFLDVAAAQMGLNATGLLPRQTALCVTQRTALAGRSYRGRTFLPGFAEDQSTSANAVAGASTAALSFMNGIRAALTAQGLTMGVVSRPNPANLADPNGWVTPVTAVQIRSLVWQTIRKRSYPGV